MPREDDEGNRTLGSATLFGLPLLVGSVWGIAQSLYSSPLGEQESGKARLVVTLFLVPLIALGFLRRAYGSLSDAVEGEGLVKVGGIFVLVSAIVLVPTSLTISGIVTWLNGMAIDGREQDVQCTAGSAWHRTRKGTDMGWHLSYSCELGGETIRGAIEHLHDRPEAAEGGPVRFRAARGRFGHWLRLSDPLPPGAVAPAK
jgi:hypothetical protein